MLSRKVNYPPKKSFNRVDLNAPRQPQMPPKRVEKDTGLTSGSGQMLDISHDGSSGQPGSGQSSALAMERTDFHPSVSLDQAQAKDLATTQKDISTGQTTTNVQGAVPLDTTKVQYPSIANQISGQIYDISSSQPGPASLTQGRLGSQSLIGPHETQSEPARHPVTSQQTGLANTPLSQSNSSSLASVLPHSQQSLPSQHNFEFTAPPGYVDNPQMTLLQQMYLQTYGAGNSNINKM